jgi:hypothetical protein
MREGARALRSEAPGRNSKLKVQRKRKTRPPAWLPSMTRTTSSLEQRRDGTTTTAEEAEATVAEP